MIVSCVFAPWIKVPCQPKFHVCGNRVLTFLLRQHTFLRLDLKSSSLLDPPGTDTFILIDANLMLPGCFPGYAVF